jgi:thiol:disulfide interchange protein DsbC
MKKIVEENTDIAFYIKMYPLTSIHSDAYRKSKTIVCEKSLKLLEEAFNGKTLPDPSCETDLIDRNIKLAQKLGINGTPAIVLPDGRLVSGAMQAEDLVKLIKSR